DEPVEGPWSEREIELDVVHGELAAHHAIHLHRYRPTALRASRRRSSTGVSPFGTSAARASRASWAESPSARRASRTSASGPTGSDAPPPSFSLSSMTTRVAAFLPTPGTTVSAVTSSDATQRRTASGES